MGIPLYFKQLSEKYPNIIVDTINNSVDGDSKGDENNLFLDLNCAIHPCCRKVLEEHSHSNNNKSAVEKKMINEVLHYIQSLVELSEAKLLYIAIDGVAPCAKMNQQRLRRYKTVYEKVKTNEIKKQEKIELNQFDWNTNAISPGTEFMDKLSLAIKTELKSNIIYKEILISPRNKAIA